MEHIELEHCKLIEDNNTLEQWMDIMQLPEDLKLSVMNAKCVIVPQNYNKAQNVFMPTAGELCSLFRQQMGDDFEICATDENFEELNQYSIKIRLGHFILLSVALPIFDSVIANYVTDYLKGEKAIEAVAPAPTDLPSYMEEPKVELRLTITDAETGKKKDLYIDGSADKVIETIHELNVTWNDTESQSDSTATKK